MQQPSPRGRRPRRTSEKEEPQRGRLMPLGDALSEFLQDSKLLQRKKAQPAYMAWDEAVGPDLSSKAQAVAFRRGELIVEVDTPSLISELRGFAAEDLRARTEEVLRRDPANAHTRLRKLTFKLKRRS